MTSITDRITTPNKRKWALIEVSFTEALVDKWTTAGFDFDAAKKWLRTTVSKDVLPIEIRNADYFRWLRDEIDIRTDTATGTRTGGNPFWYASIANWSELKKEYDFFVKDQVKATPTITAQAGTGRYTGAGNKPSARIESLKREAKETVLNMTNTDPVLALMPIDPNFPETHKLADWETVALIENTQTLAIQNKIKEELKKITPEGAYIELHPKAFNDKVRYNLLEKEYSVDEIRELLDDAEFETEKATWVTAEKNKGVNIPLWRYKYLLNPNFVIGKIENPRFIEWADSALKTNK